MNKGLAMHLIATFLYILCIMYIFQEQSTNKVERAGIVLGMFFINLICLPVCDTNNFYNQKIKLN